MAQSPALARGAGRQEVQAGQGRVHSKPRRSSGIRDPQEAGGGQAQQDEGQDEQAALRAHSKESPGFIKKLINA